MFPVISCPLDRRLYDHYKVVEEERCHTARWTSKTDRDVGCPVIMSVA